MTRGMRKLVGGIALLLFALVLTDRLTGGEFVRAIGMMFGASV